MQKKYAVSYLAGSKLYLIRDNFTNLVRTSADEEGGVWRQEEKDDRRVEFLKKRRENMEKVEVINLEPCLERAEKILKKVRNTKDPEKIKKILPSWSVLNRLHSAVSELLEYRL